MDYDGNPEAQIREALSKYTGESEPRQEDIDAIHVYSIEQNEKAEELFQAALSDGVNFAATDETGDVFINTKWLGMIVRTTAAALLVTGTAEENAAAITQSEVINQSILAARKFVAHNDSAE